MFAAGKTSGCANEKSPRLATEGPSTPCAAEPGANIRGKDDATFS
jgi:hypothetical protein